MMRTASAAAAVVEEDEAKSDATHQFLWDGD